MVTCDGCLNSRKYNNDVCREECNWRNDMNGFKKVINKDIYNIAPIKNCTNCYFISDVGICFCSSACDGKKHFILKERSKKNGNHNIDNTEALKKIAVAAAAKPCKICQYNVDRPRNKCIPGNETGCREWQQQTEIVTNNQGARQSATNYLWTDFDAKAMLRVAKLSAAGCKKYGPDNWRKISRADHIGHAITHMFQYLAGDDSEDHLAHAAWRVLAAMGVRK